MSFSNLIPSNKYSPFVLFPCCRYQFRNKLTFNVKPFALSSALPEGRGGFLKAKVVSTTLNTFMASTDETITINHVPIFRTAKNGRREEISNTDRQV